jgi:alpha-beta hydrolase superfamily lysophospholipase
MPHLRPVVPLLLTLLLVACGGGSDDDASNDSSDVKVSPVATSADSKPSGEPSPVPGTVSDEMVRFETADGVTVAGHLYSGGGPRRKVVVLAHEFPTSQKAWTTFARELATKGVDALTFDFRGYGETGGSKDTAKIDRDLESAVRFIRSRDYAQVYVFGASMGGTAALKVAARLDLAGVATLSAPTDFQGLDAKTDVKSVTEPKLFLAAKGDDGAPAAVDYFAQNAPGTETTQILEGSAHGTELLSGSTATTAKQLLFTLLGL